MKREVASSLVERGVAERVRLTQAYEKKKTELQKQHDIVKNQLNDHKEKVCTFEMLPKCVNLNANVKLTIFIGRKKKCTQKLRFFLDVTQF